MLEGGAWKRRGLYHHALCKIAFWFKLTFYSFSNNITSVLFLLLHSDFTKFFLSIYRHISVVLCFTFQCLWLMFSSPAAWSFLTVMFLSLSLKTEECSLTTQLGVELPPGWKDAFSCECLNALISHITMSEMKYGEIQVTDLKASVRLLMFLLHVWVRGQEVQHGHWTHSYLDFCKAALWWCLLVKHQ